MAVRCRGRCARLPSLNGLPRVACPDPSPTSPPPPAGGPPQHHKVPNATRTTAVDLEGRHTPRPSRSVNGRVLTFWLDRWVTRTAADHAGVDAVPPEVTPPTATIRGAEECGRSTASGALQMPTKPPILLRKIAVARLHR